MSRYQKMVRKATSVFVSVTTTIWLAGFGTLVPFAANAQSVADLQAQITALLAQITALQAQLSGGGGTSGAVSCNFTRSLTIGVQGEDVKCLQQYLNGAGHSVATTGVGSPGNETTYFGSLTRAAVSKWQGANGVSPTAGYFGPISMAKYNALIAAAPPPTTGGGTTPPPASVGTGLTVGSAAQPTATLAVQNAIHIPFTSFTLTASSDGDVTVDSVTVERTGLANDAAFAGVLVLDENMMQITQSPKALNSNHQAILTDDFTVPAGQTKKFYLAGNMAADLSSYAGQVASLRLVAVNTTAQVNGSLPIDGTGHTINASLSVGSVTLTRGTNDPNNSSITKEVGTKGYIFSALKATAGSAEDMLVKSIRWNQSGSAAKGDLENVVVIDTKSGTEYPTTVSSDGKYYTANFGSGISIKKGENTEIYIKGDIKSGSGRTVDFDLYRYDDFVFEGKTFKYKIKPTASETAADNDDDSEFQDSQPRYDASQISIGTGSIRVEKSNEVGAGNVANGTNGAELGSFKFDIDGEPISFTQWVLTIATTDADSGGEGSKLTNITIYDSNGNAVAGPADPTSVGSSVTLTDSVTVPVGENIFTVRADLNNNWENNDTIIFSFTPSSALSQVTGETTGNTVTPTPATSVAANTQTVKAGALTVTPSSSFTSQTLIEGSNGVELGRFVLDATDSGEDIKVTVIKIRADVTAADINDFVSLQLFDGTTALNTGSNVLQPPATADGTDVTLSFTLDSAGLIIPKGGTKIISLKGNITTAANAGDQVKFDFSAGVSDGDWGTSGVGSGQDITETFTTSAGATITVQEGGGWSVTAAPSQPTEKWVAAGATGVTLNVLRINATSEEFALTDLRLQIDITGSSTGADFAKIYLYNGSTLLQTKTPSFTGGVEDFTFPISGSGSFSIPKDSFKELTIKADLASIGTSLSGTAGQLVGVDYDGASNTTKNKARGQSSGSSKHSSTASDVLGNGVVYFRSVPTIERVTIPQTNLTSGNHVLYKFKVTADPAYDVALHKATFTIATSGITKMASNVPNLTLWNTTDNKRVGAATGTVAAMFNHIGNYNASNQLVVRVYADTTDYSNRWVTIPAGQTHTFELRGDITTDGTSDSVSTKLLGDDARSPRLTLTGSSKQLMQKVGQIDNDTRAAALGVSFGDSTAANIASSSSFIWSDFSSDATTTHSINTADWMNGFKLPGLLSTGLDASTLSN